MKKTRSRLTMELVAAWLLISPVAPITAQLDGPSVCQYRDGTVLNIGAWPCGSPLWAPAWTTHPNPTPPGAGKD